MSIYFEKNTNAATSKRVKMNQGRPSTRYDELRDRQLNKQYPPGTYTVVKKVNLRDGLGIDSEKIRTLNKREKVEVAEVRATDGCVRARITSPASGWASMVSSKGIQCLALEARQVGEKTWDDIKKKAQEDDREVIGMNTWNDMKNANKASRNAPLKDKHDRITTAVVSKREVKGSSKTMQCPECDTRYDACWGACPNCNGDLGRTWKADEEEAQQPPQPAQIPNGAGMMHANAAQPGISFNPTYQIMYQPVYQHMAQPTFQIDMSQQSTVHNQRTAMYPMQQMYQMPMQGATQQQMAQPMQAPAGQQLNLQQPVNFGQPMQAAPQLQYMAHSQQMPQAFGDGQRLVRGASLLQDAMQGMNGMNQQPPMPQMEKLSVNDYVNVLEAASPHGQAGDVSKKELPGLTYYPITDPNTNPMNAPQPNALM